MKFIQTKIIDELFLIFFINYFIIICLFNLDFFYIIYDLIINNYNYNIHYVLLLFFFFATPKKKNNNKKNIPIIKILKILKKKYIKIIKKDIYDK